MQQQKKIVLIISPDLKKFYDLLGEVRQLQLQQDQVNTVCHEMMLTKPERYLNDLKTQGQASTTLLPREKIHLGVMRKIIMRHLPPAIKKTTLIKYTAAKKAVLQQLCNLPPDDKRMHEIRKILKQILYNINLLKIRNSDLAILNEKIIHDLSDELGDYHDLAVAQYNTWYYRSNNPGEEDERLMTIESYFGNQKLSRRNSLLQNIRKQLEL